MRLSTMEPVRARRVAQIVPLAVALVAGCSGSPSGPVRARQLCESAATARHITDPFGVGYKVTVKGRVRATHAWASTAGVVKGGAEGGGGGAPPRPPGPGAWARH